MLNSFAVFILTYGRSDRVYTYDTLKNQGYTGDIYLVCSKDDKELQKYQKKYGKSVIVFDKNDYKGKFDIGDNFEKDNVVVFARNACRDIAKKIGVKYYLELDDDYKGFFFRVPEGLSLASVRIRNLDYIFGRFLEFMGKVKSLKSFAFAQMGDFIGGAFNNFFKDGYVRKKRKVMNCFFNCTERKYLFYGRINEDVNCYIQNGKVGDLFLSHPLCAVSQLQTQQNEGGLSEIYLESGTYVKSFYTLLYNPSCVKVGMMGRKDIRLHHEINRESAVPVILREKYKKS